MPIRSRQLADQPSLVNNGGTGLSYYSRGDMLFASGTNSLARIGVGGNGDVLVVNNGLPQWSEVRTVPLGNSGDILYSNGSAWQTLTIGLSNYFLKVVSGLPTWIDLFGVSNTFTATQNFTDIKASGNIGAGISTQDASAVLQANSTTKGFLPPRMTTTERDNIASPAEGLIIYNTTTKTVQFHNGTIWGNI